MGFTCGLVGLPNVGKSTLFSALAKNEVPKENYPFCTIDPNVGVVKVPDERLELLKEIYEPEEVKPTTLEFFDIAGLVEGASEGEGLGNQFLSHIQSVDAIIHVIRCFEDSNVTHIADNLDPERDFNIVNNEIILRDLEVIETWLDKLGEKSQNKKKDQKKEVLHELKDLLSEGQPAKVYTPPSTMRNFVKQLGLLSRKPVLLLGNVSEDDAISDKKSEIEKEFEEFALESGNLYLTLSANLEMELTELPAEENKMFKEELGIEESGLKKLISSGYSLLNLVTFFTMQSDIVQAWTVPHNTKVDEAATVIHSDFKDKFVKAEVRHWKDVKNIKSEKLLKDGGHVHIKGKDYIVRDGDIITYKLDQ